jgi:SAM-dependent methyltransferase
MTPAAPAVAGDDTLFRMSQDAAKIIDLYRRHARAWTTARGDHLHERKWVEMFRELMPRGGTVLDLGCGSGVPISRFLVSQGLRVTGVDSAPEMISMFRENLPGQTGIVGDMRMLDLQKTFDGLIAWDSVFHLSRADQRSMFRIFRDHSSGGSALLFTSGPTDGEALGSLEGEPLYHASLSGAEYRLLLGRAGFDVVAHVIKDPACGGRTVWLAQRN